MKQKFTETICPQANERLCAMCRKSQPWRDEHRVFYDVPADWDTRCPFATFPPFTTQLKTAAKAVARIAEAAVSGKPITVKSAEVERRASICGTCDEYHKGRCRLCGCRLKAKRRLATEKCPAGKWEINVSIVIPARGEQEELQKTIDSARAAGAQEIIVVDDGENGPYQGEDVSIVNDPPGQGPALSRNAGLNAAKGHVITFSDSHVRFPANSFQEFAAWVTDKKCLGSAAIQSLDGQRNWTGFGGRLIKIDAGYDARPVQRPGETCTALYGSVYAATRETWGRVGGWPKTLAWGYNEQALSLAALFANVEIRPYERMTILHRFKKRFGYATSNRKSHANRVLTHWYLFDDFADKWEAIFREHLPHGWRIAEQCMQQDEFIQEREKYQNLKRVSTEDVYETIESNNGQAFRASRRLDSPSDRTVALFTPHAPGRESLLPGYTKAVEEAGYPITQAFMVADTPRPDVREAFLTAVHLNADPLSERSAPIMAQHMANLWNIAINAGLADSCQWVWSLEDDVAPEPNTLQRMLAAAQPGVGIVTIGLRSRQGHLMVYPIKSVDPFAIDRKRKYKKQSGVGEVGSCHVGCTLIRADLLRNFRFTATPNNGSGGYGHEWSLMKACHLRQLKIVCDWDIAATHHDT